MMMSPNLWRLVKVILHLAVAAGATPPLELTNSAKDIAKSAQEDALISGRNVAC